MKRLIAALLALIPVPAMAQTIAITGGKVATGDGGMPIEGATVLIRNGRIVSVGRGAAPGGARVIDAAGKWVTPGIFGGFSRLGLVEVDAVAQTNDAAATGSPFGAAISTSLEAASGAMPLTDPATALAATAPPKE